MGVPIEGESIQIHSYKHNGHIHRVWEETTVLKGTQNLVIGGNDRSMVTEADGRTWITRSLLFVISIHSTGSILLE